PARRDGPPVGATRPAFPLSVFQRALFCVSLGNEVSGMRAIFSVLALLLCIAAFSVAQVDPRWKPNDPDRPLPPVIEAGTEGTQDMPGRPPSDATVLFGGKDKDLSQWAGEDGQPAKWKVVNGSMEVVPHSGFLRTRQSFGDCQLHVEFAEPVPPGGADQGRGNSGV